MTDGFEGTRELIRACLEYPGESLQTIATAIASEPTTVSGWIRKGKTPKSWKSWSEIHVKIERHLRSARERGAPPECCDEEWRRHLGAFLSAQGLDDDTLAREFEIDPRFVRRWRTFGEVPYGGHRSAVAKRIGYDFNARIIVRAVAVATAQYGKPLPSPFDVVRDAAMLRQAITVTRQRSGRTIAQLAKAAHVTQMQIENLGSRDNGWEKSSVAMIASVIIGFARVVQEQLAGDRSDGVADALALLRERPPLLPHAPGKRTTINWKRIEELLVAGTHRLLQYRCSDGTPAPVAYVQFCVAFEQALITTAEAITVTGLAGNTIGRWCNCRGFPDVAMFEKMREATRLLEEHRIGSSRGATPVAAPERPARPAPRSAGAAAPTVRSEALSDDPGYRVALAALTIMEALARMAEDGWTPSERARTHLIAVARHAATIGRITAEDLAPERVVPVSGTAPGLAAILGGAPALVGHHEPPRSSRDYRRPGRRE